MFSIHKSVDIDFAHHIRGHLGACINIHGHTWKFEVGLEAETLDRQGFVVDFRKLQDDVLKPCHRLLDHSLAVGEETFAEIGSIIGPVGEKLIQSQEILHGKSPGNTQETIEIYGATNQYPGGMKVAVFPFNPTSERLAEWLYGAAKKAIEDERVKVRYARIYETLHPVEAVAEYRPT